VITSAPISGPTSSFTPPATTRKRVDVETAVGLVEHGDARLQHAILEDLDALAFLAAGEASLR